VGEALAGEPAAVSLRPGAAVADAAVAQEQLGDAVTGAHEIAAQLLAGAGEVACRLRLGWRYDDCGERARHQQAHQQLGVLAVALHARPRCARRLARGDDLHLETGRGGGAVEAVAGRPRLVAGPHRLRQPGEPGDHRLGAASEPPPRELAAGEVDRRRLGRASVDIETCP
jgi:hypothetical protein